MVGVTVDEEEVWEARDAQAQVAVGEAEFAVVLPVAGEVVVAADDGEGRGEGDVGAGGADHGINRAVDAVLGLDARLGEALNGIADEVNVWFC